MTLGSALKGKFIGISIWIGLALLFSVSCADIEEKYAFAFLISSDSYVMGARVARQSLIAHGATSYDILAVITSETVSAASEKLLVADGFKIVKQHLIKYERLNTTLIPAWKQERVFSKLWIWNITEYTTIIYMDSDMVVVDPDIVSLFHCGKFCICGKGAWENEKYFNTGVMVISPDTRVFEDILKSKKYLRSYNKGDQGLLNSYYGWRCRGTDIEDQLNELIENGQVRLNEHGLAKLNYIPVADHCSFHMRPGEKESEFCTYIKQKKGHPFCYKIDPKFNYDVFHDGEIPTSKYGSCDFFCRWLSWGRDYYISSNEMKAQAAVLHFNFGIWAFKPWKWWLYPVLQNYFAWLEYRNMLPVFPSNTPYIDGLNYLYLLLTQFCLLLSVMLFPMAEKGRMAVSAFLKKHMLIACLSYFIIVYLPLQSSLFYVIPAQTHPMLAWFVFHTYTFTFAFQFFLASLHFTKTAHIVIGESHDERKSIVDRRRIISVMLNAPWQFFYALVFAFSAALNQFIIIWIPSRLVFYERFGFSFFVWLVTIYGFGTFMNRFLTRK